MTHRIFLAVNRPLPYSLKSRKERPIMLPKPQQSLNFTQQTRQFDEETNIFFSSPTPEASKPKGLIQRLYGYLQYGMYSLRYLRQRVLSQNEAFLLKIDAIPFTADINTYLLSNQSHFRLENQRNYLKPIDLNIRMIDTHFTPKSANLSFFPTNHFLDIQGLIPWTQIILYYLRKSNASSLQDKKIDSTNFFRDFTQAPSNEASFSRQYTEKNISIFNQR